MKKLTLNLDELAVDSFDTVPTAGRRGTVQARSGTTYADESCNGTCDHTCYPDSCASCDFTCGSCASCGGTCAVSCGAATCGGADTCGGTCDYATCAQPETCWMNIC
ncbi:MAG TPA: hypothetical protein VF771_14075 [Longimicrobiaceae bacterium]